MDFNNNHHTYTFWVYLYLCVAIFGNIEKKMFVSGVLVKNSDVTIYMKLRQRLLTDSKQFSKNATHKCLYDIQLLPCKIW